MIASRKNFRGEEFFTTLAEALKRAEERSLETTKVVYVGSSEGEYIVQAHGVELIKYRITHSFQNGKSNNMINLTQAKKQANVLSIAEKDKKVYIVENGVNDYLTSSVPFKGTIGCYLNGEFIPSNKNLNTTEMATKKPAKKAAKKSAAKKVASKKVAKKVVKKATATKSEGKIVDISIADMRKKMADGFYYKDPQGTRQSENYLATRAKQDHVRVGMQEFKG